uniref:Uncharacterized protein n=1 Tax=Anguilla anguilla TaxID=7936 RepID=A0A0E9PVD9_ANGAN
MKKKHESTIHKATYRHVTVGGDTF